VCFTHLSPNGKPFGSWGIHKNSLDDAKFCEWWHQDICFFKRQGFIKFVCKYYYFVLFVARLPTHCRCRGLLFHTIRPMTHTNTHTHVIGRIPLDEGSVRRRDLYLTSHKTQNRQPWTGGIRTRNPSTRGAVHPCLRSCGHWDRPHHSLGTVKAFREICQVPRNKKLLFGQFTLPLIWQCILKEKKYELLYFICVKNRNCDWLLSHYFVHNIFCYTALLAWNNFGTNFLYFSFVKYLLRKLLKYISGTH
jgi:hypothetical protein